MRRQLDPVLTGVRITTVDARRPDLRIPFPSRFRHRLRGQTVAELTRRAKYLLAQLSSGETLLMHLGMSGSFRVDPPEGARSTPRSSRSRRLRARLGRARGLHRSAPLRLHGPADRSGTRPPSRPEPSRSRTTVSRVRRRSTRSRLPRQEDIPQSCAAGSTCGRRARQHLRERSAARGRAVTAETSRNGCHHHWRASRLGAPACRGDQAGAERSHCRAPAGGTVRHDSASTIAKVKPADDGDAEVSSGE